MSQWTREQDGKIVQRQLQGFDDIDATEIETELGIWGACTVCGQPSVVGELWSTERTGSVYRLGHTACLDILRLSKSAL